MATFPRMATYHSTDALPGEEYMTIFYVPGAKGKLTRFTVVFLGTDAAGSQAAARDFWTRETAKEARRKARVFRSPRTVENADG